LAALKNIQGKCAAGNKVTTCKGEWIAKLANIPENNKVVISVTAVRRPRGGAAPISKLAKNQNARSTFHVEKVRRAVTGQRMHIV